MKHMQFWASFGFLLLISAFTLPAAELKMHDGARLAVLVDGLDDKGNWVVYLTSGEKKAIPVRNVASIFYSGRPGRFIRTGDQKFILNAGGNINAQIENMEGKDEITLHIKSQSLGRHTIPLKHFHGFTALAIQGRAGRMAEDLLREDDEKAETKYLDHILDRRGVPYAGIIEEWSEKSGKIRFEHDESMQIVAIDTFKLAGVRLAKSEKKLPEGNIGINKVRVGVRCRDGSYLVGEIAKVDPFEWIVKPSWDLSREIPIPTNEITRVDVLGGRAVYISQLIPTKVVEKTKLAPPQPFRKNENCQGESMDIGGFIYHNGLGVHANSELSYELGGKFQTFRADVGIDGRLENNGSVIFSVVGDGKVLHKTPVIKGRAAGGGTAIEVSVANVKVLTLKVDHTADLDQADTANWGGARVLR